MEDSPKADSAKGALAPIIHDALRPAAREVGSALQGAVRLALSPVNLTVWSFDQATHFASVKVAEILERRRILKGDVRIPAPELAGQAIAMLRFPDQDPSLRNLYLELLASAMDSKQDTHPSFVDVLRQLNSDEAKVLRLFADPVAAPGFAMMSVTEDLPDGSGRRLSGPRYRTLLGEHAKLGRAFPTVSVENMARLGLVKIDTARHLTGRRADADYATLRRTREIVAALATAKVVASGNLWMPPVTQRQLEAETELLDVTTFGWRLALACTSPEERPATVYEGQVD
jgi:hypothetical protein